MSLDNILMLLVPLAFTAGVWAIAIWALNLPDQQTRLLQRLISCDLHTSRPTTTQQAHAPEQGVRIERV